jgi:drug/metabolite transporter (DMT)-like permease
MRTTWPVRFAILAGIWGLSFVFIRLGDESFAPLQVAAGRLFFGALTLTTILVLRRERLPRERRTWAHLIFGAVFMNVAPFILFAYGEERVPSFLAGIWNATTPILTLPVAWVLLPDERATPSRIAGFATGFLGVLVVLGAWNGFGADSGNDLLGDAMCVAAAACYAVGFPYARRFLSSTGHSPVVLSTAQIQVAAVEAGVLALLFTGPPTNVRADSIVAVIALGAFGTGIAYILNYSVIRDAGATVATTVTYLLPIVSVVAGVLLLDEPLTWNEPVGAAVIILGALLAQGRLRWVGNRLRGLRAGRMPA